MHATLEWEGTYAGGITQSLRLRACHFARRRLALDIFFTDTLTFSVQFTQHLRNYSSHPKTCLLQP